MSYFTLYLYRQDEHRLHMTSVWPICATQALDVAHFDFGARGSPGRSVSVACREVQQRERSAAKHTVSSALCKYSLSRRQFIQIGLNLIGIEGNLKGIEEKVVLFGMQ